MGESGGKKHEQQYWRNVAAAGMCQGVVMLCYAMLCDAMPYGCICICMSSCGVTRPDENNNNETERERERGGG